MISLPNLALISGTGRNSGKTSIACALIAGFSTEFPVYAVKISPHFHDNSDESQLIYNNLDFRIFEEKNKHLLKDSSRMLAAGAAKSYYIECIDQLITPAFQKLLSSIPKDSAVICESPALRKFIKPGVFIITDNEKVVSNKDKIQIHFDIADRFFDIFQDDLDELVLAISFHQGKWTIKQF